MPAFRVVLDACVMLPQTLNDLLLTLADAELYSPVWTPDLLAEVERNLCSDKFGKTPEQAATRVRRMREAFPFAEEESRGYRELIPAMTNDDKDRHVLAAAVSSGAELIVTSNLKDFPASSIEPFDIAVISPDEFLCDQLDLDPALVLESMQQVVSRNRTPPRTLGELLTSLEKLNPLFVAAVRDLLVPHDEAPAQDATAAARLLHLPALPDDRIAQMPADVREMYLELRDTAPETRAQIMGQMTVATPAFAVLDSICRNGDLRSVWPQFDPDFRRVLAEQWVRDNDRDIRASRSNGAVVAAALADSTPDHPLWEHFERVHVRSIRASLPDPDVWGIGAAPRMIAPELELLFLHDRSTLEDGEWQPGEERLVYPILMNLVDGEWVVRNLGSEEDIPTLD